MALVSARTAARQQTQSSTDPRDPDLKRAKDLLSLHATVKLAHQDGTDEELNDAREAVARVMRHS